MESPLAHAWHRHISGEADFCCVSSIGFLLRDAMHKRGLCRHSVSVRPFVTFVNSVKTYKQSVNEAAGEME